MSSWAIIALLAARVAEGSGRPMLEDFLAAMGDVEPLGGQICRMDLDVTGGFLAAMGDVEPLGGQICRMDLDVTGDKIPEIFLGFPAPHYQNWIVYVKEASGSFRPLPFRMRPDAPPDYDIRFLTFPYSMFYYSPNRSLLSGYVRAGPRVGGWVHYRLSRNEIVEFPEGYDLSVEQSMTAAWSKCCRPPLYWVSVADLRAVSRPLWRNADTGATTDALGRLTEHVIR